MFITFDGIMATKNWFEKHPVFIFGMLIIISVLIIDSICAYFLIPKDYNAFRIPHPVYHHDLKPFQQTQNKWGDRVFDMHTNSLGFKDQSARIIETSASKKRILFMGDSFTESVGMTWQESFPGILEKEFTEIEILNASVVSYSPKLYYLKTKYLIEIKKLQFDELFVFIDNSDPLNEISYRNFEPYNKDFIEKAKLRIKRFLYKYSYLYFSISSLITNTKQNEITQSWNPMSGNAILDEFATEDESFIAATPTWSFTPALYNKWGKEGLKLAKNNMQLLADLCTKYGIKLTVIIYPWPLHISKGLVDDIQVNFWREFCNTNQIRFIDLYPPFINGVHKETILKTCFIPGDVHWNQEGHKFMADLIMPYLKKE
ncbi:MAG: hypothetical protein R2750_03240 [Bacteroidales bacterium]